MSAGTDIVIAQDDGKPFNGYLVAPKSGKGPGILLYTAIFGVNADQRDMADSFAAKGFFVLVPDLFWRVHPGPLAYNDEDRKMAFARSEKVDLDRLMADLEGALDLLKAQPGCSGRIASLGYCFGGLISVLSASRLDVEVALSYHGTRIGEALSDVAVARCPTSLHFGGADKASPPEEIAAIRKVGNPNVEIFVYDGADHGFAQPARPGYQKEAATRAYARTEELLAPLFG